MLPSNIFSDGIDYSNQDTTLQKQTYLCLNELKSLRLQQGSFILDSGFCQSAQRLLVEPLIIWDGAFTQTVCKVFACVKTWVDLLTKVCKRDRD